MFAKIATLSAIAGATAWDLSLNSNTTWAANVDSGDHAGGVFIFDNSGGAWNNGTGACTVTAGDGINFINGHGLFVSEYAGGNTWTFWNMRETDSAEVGFTVFTDNAEAPAEDFLAVSCDDSAPMNDGDMVVGAFPSDPRNPMARGVIGAKGRQWGDFVLAFPAGNGPANLTFDDPSVVVGEETNGAFTISAGAASSEDLWFAVDFDANAPPSASYQLSVTSV